MCMSGGICAPGSVAACVNAQVRPSAFAHVGRDFWFLCMVEGGACVQALAHGCVCTHICTRARACLSTRVGSHNATELSYHSAAEGSRHVFAGPVTPNFHWVREQGRARAERGRQRVPAEQQGLRHGDAPGEGGDVPPRRGWLQPWDRVGTEPLPACCSPPLRCLVTPRSATCPIGLTLEGFMKNIDLP